MTAAWVQNDKSLVLTFVTGERALQFTLWFKRRFGHDVYSHRDRRVMLVDRADYIDRAAIELRNHKSVCNVQVDWYLG